nr:hypothetical protein [Okeania sp. SIO2F4]
MLVTDGEKKGDRLQKKAPYYTSPKMPILERCGKTFRIFSGDVY